VEGAGDREQDKEYNGKVERSHRSDNEEFYRTMQGQGWREPHQWGSHANLA